MRKLLSTVSHEALLLKTEQTKIKVPISAIPKGWDVFGFQRENVYVRVLESKEKQTVRRNHTSMPFDWDKLWYGVFSIRTGKMLGISDSREKLHQQLETTSAVELYMN